MLIIGLTGSIATGKSTVSNLLRSPPYSLPVIDADILARKVVEPGTSGYNAILAHFLPTTPNLLQSPNECGGEDGPEGKGRPLNRPALGRRVFGDSDERQRDRKVLNGIVHPAVRWEMYKLMAYYYVTGYWAVVLDIPLLFESGWERFCGCIIVVSVSDPVKQMERLRERDSHLTEEDASNRVGSQTDVREKAKRAQARGKGWGEVVLNDGSKEQLKIEVERVMEEVRRRSPKWWNWLLLWPPMGIMAASRSFLHSWSMQSQWEEDKRKDKAKL
ncbi:MAG: hypothetical protein Q9165_008033 [Trypethelium subeluteriae]